MPTIKKLENFEIVRKVVPDEKKSEGFSHTFAIAKKKPSSERELAENPDKYAHQWYIKQVSSKEKAIREVIAQEFLRLLFPHYPKTRLISNGVQYFVGSKEVEGLKQLPYQGGTRYEILAERLSDPKKADRITGMGHVVIGTLIVEDEDLKDGNAVTDKKNRIVKFDGGGAFSRPNLSSLTESDIDYLPYLKDNSRYYNYFDLITEGKLNKNPTAINYFMSDSDHPVRHEINEAMLRAFLLPSKLKENFSQLHVRKKYDDTAENLNGILIDNIDGMKKAALKNDYFCDYMLSKQAVLDFNFYVAQLDNFAIGKKEKLTEAFPKIFERMKDKFDLLRESIRKSQKKAAEKKDVVLENSAVTSSTSAIIQQFTATKLATNEVIAEELTEDNSDFSAFISELEKMLEPYEMVDKGYSIIKYVTGTQLGQVDIATLPVWKNFVESLHNNEDMLPALSECLKGLIKAARHVSQSWGFNELGNFGLGKVFDSLWHGLIELPQYKEAIKNVVTMTEVSDLSIFFGKSSRVLHEFFNANELKSLKSSQAAYLLPNQFRMHQAQVIGIQIEEMLNPQSTIFTWINGKESVAEDEKNIWQQAAARIDQEPKKFFAIMTDTVTKLIKLEQQNYAAENGGIKLPDKDLALSSQFEKIASKIRAYSSDALTTIVIEAAKAAKVNMIPVFEKFLIDGADIAPKMPRRGY